MKLDYAVNISTAKILRRYGLGEDKAAQRFLAEDVERKCQPYVPMSAGSAAHMVNAARVTADSIIYPGPYAHYQYVGEGMAGRAPKHYTGTAADLSWRCIAWQAMGQADDGRPWQGSREGFGRVSERTGQMKNIMEEVRKFLRTYPPLAEGKLHVIFCQRRHRAIRLRLCLQRRLCVPMWTAQRCGSFYLWWQAENFSGDKIKQQLDNLSFYGDFSEWLREQTMAGSLPNLGEGRKVMLMEATTSGYAMAAEASMARYQIQCRMEFFQTR